MIAVTADGKPGPSGYLTQQNHGASLLWIWGKSEIVEHTTQSLMFLKIGSVSRATPGRRRRRGGGGRVHSLRRRPRLDEGLGQAARAEAAGNGLGTARPGIRDGRGLKERAVDRLRIRPRVKWRGAKSSTGNSAGGCGINLGPLSLTDKGEHASSTFSVSLHTQKIYQPDWVPKASSEPEPGQR